MSLFSLSALSGRDVILLDCDDNLCAGNGGNLNANLVPDKTCVALKALQDRGVVIVLVTGAPWCLAQQIVDQLREYQIHVWLAADYGGAIKSPDGHEQILVDQAQLDVFTAHRARIETFIEKIGGTIDRRNTRFQFNAFFNNVDEWNAARDAWFHWLGENPAIADLFTESKGLGPADLSTKWNSGDNSMNVCVGCGSKQRIVDWATQQGLRIVAAGGDSGGDIPLAEAAEVLFYVSLGENATELSNKLVQIATRKGTVYTAPEGVRHGHGLALAIWHLIKMRYGIAA